MRGSVCQLLLLAHTVCAITGPRVENDFDRRRQAPVGLPGFNEHQTRFGLSSPLQNFQAQSNIVSSPPPAHVTFQQPIFQQPQQQPYVPQFNHLLPTQSVPTNVVFPNNPQLQNNFQYNQVPNTHPGIQSTFQTQTLDHIRPPNQNIFSQPIPTHPTFQNNVLQPAQNNHAFNHNPNIQGQVVNIGQQRPTQPAFLPTLPTTQNQLTFSQQSPITIQPAPNLAPQSFNLNNAQVPFQSTLGQQNVFSNNQNSQIQSFFEQQSKENLEKLKELQERQRIIQKHQEFVEKQKQKQQEKVEKLHEEFVSKQATKTIPTYTTTSNYEEVYNRNQDRRRPIQQHEKDLFRKAVEMYEKQHPTTTTSTTTSTTTTTTTTPAPSRYRTRPKQMTRKPPQDKHKQQLYSEIKNLLEESETKGFDDNLRAKSVALLQKPDILKQLKVALAENPEDFNEKNFTSREISLNGQKFEVIRTTNPNLIPKGALTAESLAQLTGSAKSSPQKESRISFEDLTKGVLPPGADFELIKQTENGKLEEVSKIPKSIQNKKKVTFVFLEEQDDGTYKVKGVKANGQQTEEGPEVESILQKIKNGEIHLPGPTKISNTAYTSTAATPSTEGTDYIAESSHHPSSYSTYVTTSNHGSTGHSNPVVHTTAPPTNYRTSNNQNTWSSQSHSQTQTYSPTTRVVTTTERYYTQPTTPSYTPTRNSYSQTTRNTYPSSTIVNTTPSYRSTPEDLVVIGSSTIAPSIDAANSHLNYVRSSNPGLVDILKENGLFATAKYLHQSGLDTILNETGPYTIFAPTDKAFRTLLVQLGGPDRAEEKFRDNPRLLSGTGPYTIFAPTDKAFRTLLVELGGPDRAKEKFRDNPRLLSGLLLHHVIPGAFDIGSLQDEMTGVSLAGTQLRVNQYDMHDVEWNEVKVTTINGARVLEDKKDIHIPQGIAHAVDRVMFPLPVGDVVQTLQADRDRRFTTFLKAVLASGFQDTLSESKTYTVFAPTDAAFARLAPSELARLAERAAARALVGRHVLRGALYSAGMRYYQLRNSMEDAKPLTLQKNAGRIKVNNAQVVTHNIPATNGVIHAVDALL